MFNTTVNSDEDVIKYGRLLLIKVRNLLLSRLAVMVLFILIKKSVLKQLIHKGKWLIQLALVIVQLQAWWLELLQV